MNLTSDGIRQTLARLSPRERTLIGYAIAVVLLGGTWSLVDWSLSERERLGARLPEARAELSRMQADAARLHDLSTRRAPTWPDADQAPTIISAAARAQGIAVDMESTGNRLQLSTTGEPGAVLMMLANLQADFGLRSVKVDLHTENGSSRFRIELSTATP